MSIKCKHSSDLQRSAAQFHFRFRHSTFSFPLFWHFLAVGLRHWAFEGFRCSPTSFLPAFSEVFSFRFSNCTCRRLQKGPAILSKRSRNLNKQLSCQATVLEQTMKLLSDSKRGQVVKGLNTKFKGIHTV